MSMWWVHTTSCISGTVTLFTSTALHDRARVLTAGYKSKKKHFCYSTLWLLSLPYQRSKGSRFLENGGIYLLIYTPPQKKKQLKLHAADNLLTCSKVPLFTPYFPPLFSWWFKKICETSSYYEHFSITARKLEIMRRVKMKFSFILFAYFALLLKIVINMEVTVPLMTYEKWVET